LLLSRRRLVALLFNTEEADLWWSASVRSEVATLEGTGNNTLARDPLVPAAIGNIFIGTHWYLQQWTTHS